MGPVNWIAVVLAAAAASALSVAWFGSLFRRSASWDRVGSSVRPARAAVLSVLLMLVTATMLGHFFARVGAETLGAKPWLYFMMSGGLAIAFVIPALWTSLNRLCVPMRDASIDAAYWLAAYLAMGTVFYALG